jgi:glycosyltransferase involved in cell wall biosynthesis
MSISVTVLVKNGAETIEKTLRALHLFSEVIVADTGSTDRTKEIARQFPNVKVVDVPFEGFGKTHNLASSLATHDWILSIDSDEVVEPMLAEEILALKLDQAQVYRLNRQNYFNGKWIRCCSGWYPDRIVRLYHRRHTQFNEVAVHEAISSDHLQIVSLEGNLLHTPYRSIESFLVKMQFYSTLFAEQNKGKKSSLGKAIGHGIGAFLKNYFLKRGFLGGREGFIISLYNAHTTYYKYLKLAEKQLRE